MQKDSKPAVRPFLLVLYSLVFSVINFTSYSYDYFITAYTIESQEIKKISELVDKNTLVIIELDNTLIRPKSKLFLNVSPYKRLIDAMEAAHGNGSSTYTKALGNWYTNRKIVLMEEGWINFIKTMKAKGATVLGFSAMSSSIYSIIKEPENWQYSEVKDLGVNFTNKIGNDNILQIASKSNGNAVFFNGIIFAGRFPKAQVLKNFLMVSNLMPNKLIIFDSNKNRLQEMNRAVRSVNLDTYAICYKALSQIQEKIDDKIATFQEEMLMYKGVWLEDDEAALRYEKESKEN